MSSGPETVAIDRYERLSPIGSGGFSQVYQAWQPDFNRWVAVKVLTLQAGQAVDRQGFERECRAMGSVSEHPNIVTVYDSGFTKSGRPFIAMERYQETLLDRIKSHGPLPPSEVLDTGVQTCAALQRAHDAGILHRDIKPQNILFNNYGDPVLADFGIASAAGDGPNQQSVGMSVHYAAPEVVEGGVPGIESDLYSLGATLYTALAGHRPFATSAKESRSRLITRILTESPPPINVQTVPAPVERAILSLLAKHPNDRPRTAIEAANVMRDLQTQMGLTATPLRVSTVDNDDDDFTIRRNQTTSPPSGPNPSTPTAAPSRWAGSASAGPVPAPPSGAQGFDDTSASVTTYRPVERQRPTAEFAEPPKDRRLFYAFGALAVVVGLGAIGAIISLSGDDSPDAPPSTISAPTSTTINNLTAPETPVGLVQRQVGDEVHVTWDDVEEADRFVVEFTVGSAENRQVDTPLINLSTPTENLCLTVKAVSRQGRPSRPTEPFCIDP